MTINSFSFIEEASLNTLELNLTELSAILENSSDVIFIRDLVGRYVMINETGAKVYGLQPEDFLGRTIFEMHKPEAAGSMAESDQRVLATGKPDSFEFCIPVNGKTRFFQTTKGVIRDKSGNPTHLFGISRDITDSKSLEKQLSLFDELQFLEQAGRELSASLSPNAVLSTLARLVVPRFGDWCVIDCLGADGIVHREAGHHHDSAFQPLIEKLVRDYPPGADHPIKGVLESGTPLEVAEVTENAIQSCATDTEHIRIWRELGFGSFLVLPLDSRESRRAAISLVSRKPDFYRTLDTALARSLAQRAALALDNAALHERTQLALKARDEFLGIASHELKTPFTVLKLHAQYMKTLARDENFKKVSSAQMRELAEMFEREVDRLNKLAANLLDVTNFSSGKVRLNFSQFDLSVLLREVATRLRLEAQSASSRLELKLPETPIEGRWDRMRIDQVVTNLLMNAIKYGLGKPIVLEARAEPNLVHISITDQGIGISQEDQKRVFRRFERASSIKGYAGLGLGLYITSEIVNAHQGSISIKSAVGQGAAFTVQLPRAPSR